MKQMKRIFTLALIMTLGHAAGFAQVGISTDASVPDTSAMLDIKSTTKGILVPRMTSVQRAAITKPAKGLLVYDSTTTTFWYHNGVAWNELTGGGSGWGLTGNSDLSPQNNFIGTRDNEPLVFKVNNTMAGILDPASNAAFGLGALTTNTVGHNLVAIGDSAMYNQGVNSNGQYENVAVGSKTLFSNISGYGNTAVGHMALYTNGTGAITANDEGTRNTALGDRAMFANTKGLYNTAVGYASMAANTTGYFNAGFGYGTLGANTTGINNTAIGLVAMAYNTQGSNNTALGARALQSNISGSNNIAIGSYALYNTTGANDLIAIGDSALFNQLNLRFGYYGNIAIGTQTLYANTSGTNNTATGYNALIANTTGGGNTALGSFALRANITGTHNTSIGSNTLNATTAGTSLTVLGYQATASADNLTNATAIGANATVAQSNSLILGSVNGQNGATAPTSVGIGVTTPLAPLHIHSANADNYYAAKTLYLDDDNGIPTIRFQGSGAYNNRFWNITLEPYTPTSGDNAGIPTTSLVFSNNFSYPEVRFETGLAQFVSDVDMVNDAKVEGTLRLSRSPVISSDIRLKERIEPLKDMLPKLMKLNGYTYYLKDHKDTTLQVGVLAQELQKIFPELVETDKQGMLAVRYTQLIPVLLTAIKEQQKEIDGLKERMDKMEAVLKGK